MSMGFMAQLPWNSPCGDMGGGARLYMSRAQVCLPFLITDPVSLSTSHLLLDSQTS